MSRSKFFAIATLFATSLFAGAANASPFTPEQLSAHPCLSKVAMPRSLSLAKQSDLPAGVAPAYAGVWHEPDGKTTVCTALFLLANKRAIYTVDPQRYNASLTEYTATIKQNGAGFSIEVWGPNWPGVNYNNPTGGVTLTAVSSTSGKTGTLTAVLPLIAAEKAATAPAQATVAQEAEAPAAAPKQ